MRYMYGAADRARMLPIMRGWTDAKPRSNCYRICVDDGCSLVDRVCYRLCVVNPLKELGDVIARWPRKNLGLLPNMRSSKVTSATDHA
jgi:hypothetical protein